MSYYGEVLAGHNPTQGSYAETKECGCEGYRDYDNEWIETSLCEGCLEAARNKGHYIPPAQR
jgi:hypothetical protein